MSETERARFVWESADSLPNLLIRTFALGGLLRM